MLAHSVASTGTGPPLPGTARGHSALVLSSSSSETDNAADLSETLRTVTYCVQKVEQISLKLNPMGQ